MQFRKRLSLLDVEQGTRFMVYFPGKAQPRVLIATGQHDSSKNAFEMRDENTGHREWVPDWLVAAPLQKKVGLR